MEELKRRLIAKLRPSIEERQRIEQIIKQVKEKVEAEASRLSVDVEVKVEGSIAKDTWISGDRDIDVFIRLPPSLGKKGLEELGLKIARAAAGQSYLENYAEHPYIQAFIEGYRIDLVPCFKLEKLEGEVTAVDRTPFHTAFIKAKLSEEARDEVRLLKGFMKGVGVYGAEIKVQGFSGYLCELLVLHYGGFRQVLEAATSWRPREVVIDIAGHYSKVEDALNVFDQPLIVVDPVDAKRNVAAALSLQRMAEFVVASRLFLKTPSEHFFFPPPPREISHEELGEHLKVRGVHIVALEVKVSREPPDILWGQLYKSLEGFEELLMGAGFEVLDRGVWSDEEKVAVFTFELPHVRIPRVKKQLGPPVSSAPHEERFLQKHVGKDLKGPRLEDWRWIAYSSRKYVDAAELLREQGHRARLGKVIQEGLRREARTYMDLELAVLLDRLEGYRLHLSELLDGRPRWLRAYMEAAKLEDKRS